MDESKLAFFGWKDVAEPWNFSNYEAYIKWCHISRDFPYYCYKLHRKTNKANLYHCKWHVSKEQYREMCQYIYNILFLERDKCPLSILLMVYAKVVLRKQVDWTIINIQLKSNIKAPLHPHFGSRKKFLDVGLGKKMPSNEKRNELVVWSATFSDNEKTSCT